MEPKTVSTRRHFFCKAGAALSAPIALSSTAAAGAERDAERLQARIQRLEDENAIRELDRAFAERIGSHERVAELFADGAEIPSVDGLRGFAPEHFEHEWIEVVPELATAFAAIRCTAELETPIEPSCTLVEMARLQGGGVVRRSEEGVLQHTYVKRNGVWKLARSVYQPA